MAENAGKVMGAAYGVVLALGTFLRGSHLFHAQGYVFHGKVESPTLGSDVIVRFSSALWKTGEWPDVLGLAIRFEGKTSPQDLLFVSTDHVWKLPINVFTSHNHDFLKNIFYSITPFSFQGRIVKFRAVPRFHFFKGNRIERLREAMKKNAVIFELQEGNASEWRSIGTLSISSEASFPQEMLHFTPFNVGLGIIPRGFVNHLRLYTYQFCQRVRSGRIESEVTYQSSHS